MIDVPLAATSHVKLSAKIDGRECFETSQSTKFGGEYLLFIIRLAATCAFSAVGITGINAQRDGAWFVTKHKSTYSTVETFL